MICARHLYGLNTYGEVVVPTKYDAIDNFNVYKKNLAVVTVDGKQGLINIDGQETLAPLYDSLKPLDGVEKK